MDSIIRAAIKDSRYVNVHNAIIVTNVGQPYRIHFDSAMASTIYGWNGKVCSGNIELHLMPTGYAPDLTIEDVQYRYIDYKISNTNLMLVVADSKDVFDSWMWYQLHKNDKPPSTIIRDVYSWSLNCDRWYVSGTYRSTSIESIVGLDGTYHDILSDIDILLNKRDIINSLDMTPSCNYLLESRPGMGKTSLIRAICTYLNVPMHTVTAKSMMQCDPSLLLSSPGKSKVSVVLFEDFDRYLKISKEEQMESILNTLDGVADMPITVRFFTTNSSIDSPKLEAFMSRMRRHIIMEKHNIDAYAHSINIVFPSMDDDQKKHVGTLFSNADITMRVANQILCASMVYQKPLAYIEKAISNIHLVKPSKTIVAKRDDDDD